MRRRLRLARLALLLGSTLLVLLRSRLASAFSCDGGCSGHGVCSSASGRCQCFPGYIGATCASLACPMGTAWADYATETDVAHNLAECSAMGACDRSTGSCKCQAGFEGIACERMACPACTNGRCVSMREAAEIQDDTNFFVATTYSLWDADKIFGCQCDNGFEGFDCSQRTCPKGDDPMTTGQVDEVQHLNCLCDGCAGTFVLSFRRRATVNLSPSATWQQLEAALEALDTIHGVSVTLSGAGSTICDADGATASITFTHNPGDLPALQVQSRLTGGTSELSVSTGGALGGYDSVGASVDGTREAVDCSNRGTCDSSAGVCKCFPGFSSSDGAGGVGNLGDCGYGTATTCPVTSNGVCDGKGTCSSSPFVCDCWAGFTGFDCTIRTCPSGIAWFDGATDVDTAHAMAPCSNKGSCDVKTGLCTCLSPFTGSACEVLKCPGTALTCNGRGTCKTMQQLAAAASSSTGDLRGVTYGDTLNTLSTWDYNKIQGCDCAKNAYFGPYEDAFGEFDSYDCSTLFCPTGADPFETGTVNEQQRISCQADGGTFALKFRQQMTSGISYQATESDVKAALEKLTSVREVNVAFDGGAATVCGAAAAVVTTVEFTFMQGDLPPMTVVSNALTLTSSTAAVSIEDDVVRGTKANLECSARGVCDRTSGVCSCFDHFLSSDGDGNFGRRGDCGYRSPY